MEVNPLIKKYKVINEQVVLFNEEYYLSVSHADISSLDSGTREQLFNHLYAFDSNDMELEIDVSEEEEGKWYLQLLVPHVLTLPEAAIRRIDKGTEQLLAHLGEKQEVFTCTLLRGNEIFEYVKRYNPDLDPIS
ncbi:MULTISPECIES: hypothetical protein [Brevibacillus]|uniref:hypothetical protein n=1 Tax=Brevibacillus TaxID=55080 RepID=UPI00203F1767|nr:MULTISPECIES: hypothetical protein [Brevibacillus]MCM3079039.1 hypothetical protein [Brevibacillus invocatus]MCM3429898.1 hypothetical protein [Brevibacillus invocatus]MDH4617093.1 hypothetical protein [Brevibacillus sp. AY1]